MPIPAPGADYQFDATVEYTNSAAVNGGNNANDALNQAQNALNSAGEVTGNALNSMGNAANSIGNAAGNIGGSINGTVNGGGSSIGGNSIAGSLSQIGTMDRINTGWSLMELIQMLVVYAFLIAAALSAVFIFIGGISFILSGGNDEKIKQAVNTIRYAIVGLIITILSFTLVTIVGRMFGLNFMDYLSFDQIINSVNQLTQKAAQEPTNAFRFQQ